MDPDNPYFYLELRGKEAERVLGPEADAHVDTLAKRYLGQESFDAPGEVRVLYKIEPTHVVTYGE